MRKEVVERKRQTLKGTEEGREGQTDTFSFP